jgi:hypothetical protein
MTRHTTKHGRNLLRSKLERAYKEHGSIAKALADARRGGLSESVILHVEEQHYKRSR